MRTIQMTLQICEISGICGKTMQKSADGAFSLDEIICSAG
jgi:hypothetical protein